MSTLSDRSLYENDIFRQLIRMQACGIVAYTLPERRMIMMNDMARRMYDLPVETEPDEASFFTAIQNVRLEDPAETKPALMALQKDGDSCKYFIRIPHRDGSVVRVSVTSQLLEVDDGQKIIMSSLLDVSEETQLREMRFRDAVTGGLNRRGFIREVRSFLGLCEDKSLYGVAFINIKNFKAVNELVGFEGGDELLAAAYDLISETESLESIFVARIEADHFVALVRRDTIRYDLLTKNCDIIWHHGDRQLHIYSRVGFYFIAPDDETPVSGMIDRAYLAKQHIRDEYVCPYAFFEPSMRRNYMDTAEAMAEFEEAISRGDFKIYYQPIVDAMTGRLVSAEALARWEHPERGYISPAGFIPALEKNGHISSLDWYALKEVAAHQEKRYREGKSVVPVSVNFSWMDFYDEAMMNRVVELLDQHNVPGGDIRIEVTETSFAALEQSRKDLLEEFRNKGAEILLDDFGSGYSSFSMLSTYYFDILKIDINFIRQIEHSAKVRKIIRSIVDMCHQIGIKVVAEGAENQEQVEYLRNTECDSIQGYYYAKPMPADVFDQYVDMTERGGRILRPGKQSPYDLRSYYKEGISYLNNEIKNDVEVEDAQIVRLLYYNHATGVMGGKCDTSLTIAYVSDFALRLMGYTLEEMKEVSGGSLWNLIAEEDRAAYLPSRPSVDRYYSLICKGGEKKPVIERRSVFTDSRGNKQWTISISEDNRHRSEEQTGIISGLTRGHRIGVYVLLATGSYMLLGAGEDGYERAGDEQNAGRAIQRLMESDADESYWWGLTFFLDYTTVAKRLERRQEVRFDFQNKGGHWCRASWTAILRDGKGHATHAMLLIDDINAEVKSRESMDNQSRLLQQTLDNYRVARHESGTDFLTGLSNRRDMFEMLQSAVEGTHPAIYAMFMMDIDNFKLLNDRYGHIAGDKCLQELGHVLNLYGAEKGIHFYRYGGEEILGVLIDGSVDAAAAAEEMLDMVRCLDHPHVDNPGGIVTVSIGYTTDNSRYEKMIGRADSAMYAAKQAGRNRALSYEDLKASGYRFE